MKKLIALSAALALASPALSQDLMSGRYNATPPTLGDGEQRPIQLDQNGRQVVDAKGDIDQFNTRLGNSFSVGTGVVSIPANNYLNVVFTCGAPTGSVCIVYLRKIGNSSTTVLQYQNFRQPTAISGGSTSTAGNKTLAANTRTTTSNLTYATASTAITTGTAAITDFVYPTADTVITPSTILKPGDTFGVSVSGIGGVLASATNVAVVFIEAETTL